MKAIDITAVTRGLIVSALAACICVSPGSAVTITIDHTTTYQTIVGFGGSVGNTPSNLADWLMNDAAVSVLRLDWCETTDPNFGNTKTCYDAATVKPVVVGSCWSPPASMKDNGNLNNGGHLLAAQYDAFANYTIQKLQQFKTMYGFDLYALSPQNEPQFAVFYASCVYTGADLIQVMKLIGQKIEDAGLTTKIFLPEDMFAAWSSSPYFPPLMQDAAAQAYVHALAFHGYAADGVTPAQMSSGTLANMYRQAHSKGWELWQTENAGSFGMNYAWDVIGCLRYGKLSMYLKYGLIGDAPGMVGDVNEYLICQNARTHTFYVAKTLHKFIARGSIQLKSTSSDSASFSSFVAFRDPAKNALAISMVTGSQAQSVQLAGTSLPSSFEVWVTNASTNCVNQGSTPGTGTFNIPANSVATLYGTGYNPPTGVRQPRGIRVARPGWNTDNGSVYGIDGRRFGQSAGQGDCHGVVIEARGGTARAVSTAAHR